MIFLKMLSVGKKQRIYQNRTRSKILRKNPTQTKKAMDEIMCRKKIMGLVEKRIILEKGDITQKFCNTRSRTVHKQY